MIQPFQIRSGPRVRFGRGESAAVGEEARTLGMKRPMLLTDPGLAAVGGIDPVIQSLRGGKSEFCLFDQVEADPSDQSILRAKAFFDEEGCDGLIAAGGGSTMDTAKAALAVVATRKAVNELYGFEKVGQQGPPLITVPTTAGTGSEVTSSAIVTDTERRIKAVVSSRAMFAQVAVVDPGLLAKLPRPVAAGTLMDALTHAIESYGSPRSNPWTEELVLHAVASIGRSGRAFVDNPGNPDAADSISLASTLAGHCFTNTSLGIVHSLAHPIGAYYHVHHGTCNGILLPPVMVFNLPAMKEKYARLAPLLGGTEAPSGQPDEDAVGAAIEAVRLLARDIGIPANLREAGVTEEHLETMARDAAESPQVRTNPVPASEEDLRNLLRMALG